MTLKNYFDVYTDLSKTDMEDYEKNRWRRYKPFLSFMKVPRGCPVLEVGCGQGELAELVHREKCVDVVGFDLSLNYLKKVKRRGLDVVRGVAEYLPFKSNAFCSVVLDCIMEHVIDTETVMDEARRVSKNKIYIEVPYKEKLQPYVYGTGMPHIRSFDDKLIDETFNPKRTLKIYLRNPKLKFFYYPFLKVFKSENFVLLLDRIFIFFGLGEPVFILVESVENC